MTLALYIKQTYLHLCCSFILKNRLSQKKNRVKQKKKQQNKTELNETFAEEDFVATRTYKTYVSKF